MKQIYLIGFFLSFQAIILAEDYPVDENIFLKQAFDFTPKEEKHLDDQWLVPPDTPYSFPKSKIENVNGILRMTSKGKALNFFCRDVGKTVFNGAPLERQLREEGIKFFQINTNIHKSLDKDPHHAFKLFKKRADNLLMSVPDAKFMVRVWMVNVSDDFAKKYPDALLAGPTGETNWKRKYHTNIQSRPNALNEWRRYCGKALYQFIHDVGKSKYAKHVVGFYVAALKTGEWWYYKGKGDPGWDYSPTRKKAFEYFINLKYNGQLQYLKPSSLSEGKDADIFALPSLKERSGRPLVPCSKVSDYLQVLNLPVSNAAKYFAKIIKKATSGNALAGMEIHAGLECFPANGTVFLSQVMDSPDIDFLGGPSSYSGRGPGSSPLHRNTSASLKKHNMLWFNEGDYRTHNAYGTKSGAAGEPPISLQLTIEVFRREFIRSMIKNYSTYLMDFHWTWFYDRNLIQEIGKLEQIGDFMTSTGLERNCEIAVVSDQESQLYANWFANPNHMRRHSLEKIGCDYEFYELHDFLKGDTYKKYKFIIFLNIRSLSDPERQEIEKIKSDNRLVLWMHDPGLVNLSRKNGDIDKDLLDLTGIKLKYGIKSKGKIIILNENYRSIITDNKSPKFIFEGAVNNIRKTVLMKEVSISDTSTGLSVGNVTAPIECVDSEATPLGKDQNGKCRFAIRKFKDWTSIYTATCLVLPEIIRNFAKLSGSHIYLDTNDICWANNRFVSVHASIAGTKTITLPCKTDVYEVFSRKIVATDTKRFSVPLKWGETRLYFLGNAKEAEESLLGLEEKRNKERKIFISKNPAPQVPLVNYTWTRSLPLKQFFSLKSKWVKAPETPDGPYELNKFTPYVFLVSGPYSATSEVKDKIAALAVKAGNAPSEINWTTLSTEFINDDAGRRTSSNYLYLVDCKPTKSLVDILAPWRVICCSNPWINDYDLDIGKNQTGVIAFFLEGKIGQEIELVFAAVGDVELWINGKKPEGEKGPFGTIITLSKKRNLVMIRLTNIGRTAGFTCKFIQPGQKLKRGQQATKVSKGLSVWLKPQTDKR